MASTTAELVKEKLDIVEVIRSYVPLTPAGKNWKAPCPFHKEKTPSFMVSPDRQSWHCFGGCNEGGDVISFLMKFEHLEFIEALRVLAERAGVDIRLVGRGEERQYAMLYEVVRAAKEFFRGNLLADGAAAKAAREYLANRGLKPETIEEFELGLAPAGSDTLTRHLAKAGFPITEIERAGLTMKTERGTYWDRFRSRIMFPLANSFGKAVGFTGRVMPGTEAEGVGKYVNSPETPLFSKSKVLFGFHKSKAAIREVKAAVLVEGQMDFLMAWQDGVRNVIATSGTALTADHLRALRRSAETLILGFDADAAGQLAVERTVDLAAAEDFSIKVLGPLPQGAAYKDPADMVLSSPGLFSQLAQSARPVMQHFFDRYLVAGTVDFGETKRGIRAILRRIRPLASPVERSHWIQELSRRSGVGEAALMDEMSGLTREERAARGGAARAAATAETPQARSRHERIAERLITLASREAPWLPLLEPHRAELPEPYAAFAVALAGGAAPADAALAEQLGRLTLRAGLEAGEPAALRSEFDLLLRELAAEHRRVAREAIASRIRAAEAAGDEARLSAALAEFDTLSKAIQNS